MTPAERATADSQGEDNPLWRELWRRLLAPIPSPPEPDKRVTPVGSQGHSEQED